MAQDNHPQQYIFETTDEFEDGAPRLHPHAVRVPEPHEWLPETWMHPDDMVDEFYRPLQISRRPNLKPRTSLDDWTPEPGKAH